MSFVTSSYKLDPEEMAIFTNLLELVRVEWKSAPGRQYQTFDVSGMLVGFKRAFFLKLPPGGRLHWHSDVGDFQTDHVVIKTNQGCLNMWRDAAGNEHSIHLQEGMRYKVDRTLPHAAVNLGATDRVHLLLEYV